MLPSFGFFFQNSLLLFFEFSSLFSLNISLLLHFNVIFNSLINGFFVKTRLVNEWYCHVTSKLCNLPIVHFWLSYHFLYKFMLISLKNIFLSFFFLLFILIIWLLFFFSLSEKLICNSLILTQNLSNHNILMTFIGIFKFDNHRCFIFNVCLVIVIIIDRLHLLLQLTYINTCCSDVEF